MPSRALETHEAPERHRGPLRALGVAVDAHLVVGTSLELTKKLESLNWV